MIPNMMNFGMPQLSMPVAGDQLKSVNGIEGAKQFPVSPNSRVALFDMNEDIVYIKTQMLEDKLADTQAKLVAAQNAISNANQSQYLLGQLGRFVAWAGDGTATPAGN